MSRPSSVPSSIPSSIPSPAPVSARPSHPTRTPSWAAGPPGTDAPPTCEVPHFAPLRVRGGAHRLRRLARCRRRAMAAGLAVTAAALLATGAGPGEAERVRGHPVADPVPKQSANVAKVAAPVRIADGATVRLLRPGNRVDVIAAEESATGTGVGAARVVARGARVTKVPTAGATESGALVVLSVPRPTAARLAGAGATSRLAVTLW
ncbi:hypothetical protein [Streptomyces capitiformicae]|nr:hypothetical protein [Streptomyces capitiformicae]